MSSADARQTLSWADKILKRLIYWGCFLLSKAALRLKIEYMGKLPASGPLILIANHFSWFEAPLLYLYLPYESIWFGAQEVAEHPFVRLLMRLYHAIPVWRGQVDRQALRQALSTLEHNGVLGIMPEGNIDPDLVETVRAGELAAHSGSNSRLSGQLIRGRPGAAYLAATSGAPVLPIAFIGTEQIQANMRRFRRTSIAMRVGAPFGPVSLPAGMRGQARKAALQQIADQMMGEIAALMPAENRGVYRK